MLQQIITGVKAVFAFILARPSRSHAHSIGVLAGNGGWNAEDSNHYRA